MWKRSCSRPAERRLCCPGWGQCNTFLQREVIKSLVRSAGMKVCVPHLQTDLRHTGNTTAPTQWTVFSCYLIVSGTDRCCIQGDRARAPDRWWQDAPCCHQEDPRAAEAHAAKNLGESGSGNSWAYRTHTSGPVHGKRIKKNKHCQLLDKSTFSLTCKLFVFLFMYTCSYYECFCNCNAMFNKYFKE